MAFKEAAPPPQQKELLALLNQLWVAKEIPNCLTNAQVVLIHQKRDTHLSTGVAQASLKAIDPCL
eukprot:4071497-Prorocentrum_lima.AAC.1